MPHDEIAQLFHEGYHSLETIAKWAKMPVWHVEAIYQEAIQDGVYTA